MTLGDGGRRLHVGQGQQQVSNDPGVCLTTLLGSCISACLWDPEAGIGGMNHFLLPEAPDGGAGDRRYGVQAMELLINGLLLGGARRDRLRAKVFGGGRMLAGLADIGGRNAAFVRRFLRDEAIGVEAECLGGAWARRVQFWPVTGRARRQCVDARAAPRPDPRLATAPPCAGVVEIF